jgi:hypothetical protein
MAISWGPWEKSGTNGMRVGIDISWSTPTYTSTSVTATLSIYTQNIQTYTGDAQTLTYGGSISGTTNYTNTGGVNSGTTSNPDSARLRATKTHTYTYSTYGTSPGSRTFTATVSGAFNNVTPSKSLTSSIPARPANNPSAPSISSTPNNGSISVSYGAPSFYGGSNPPVVGDGVTIAYYQWSTDTITWNNNPSNPFTVSGANGTQTFAYVRAISNLGLEGAPAGTSSTPRTVPSAPTSFSANSATFGQITLSWGAPSSNGGAGVTSYVLRNGSTVLQNSTATSYTHTGLAPSTTYSYTVTAVNVAGESTASSISATTIGGYAKVWTGAPPSGSGWVTLFPKVWTGAPPSGSGWVEAQARVWNGSEWKHGI